MSAINNREKEIYKVTFIGLIVNFLLSVFKFVTGVAGRSSAMVADAVHSLSDLVSDCIVICFVKISSRQRDADHPYGHGKYETLATMIIALILLGVGAFLLLKSINLIMEISNGTIIPRPGIIAFIAAAVSIVVKEVLYWYTFLAGKKLSSKVLAANAWHHRSDALSSIGTLIGVGGAYFLGEKWRILDPIAAVIVSVLIIKVSVDMILPCINELMEKALPAEKQKEILEIIMEESSVKDPHNLKTRSIGNNIAIEVHIRLKGEMTVTESHQITVKIESRLKEKYGDNTLVIIHVEPIK